MNKINVLVKDHDNEGCIDNKLSNLLAGVLSQNIIDSVIRSSSLTLDGTKTPGCKSQRLRDLWIENISKIGGIPMPSSQSNLIGFENERIKETVDSIESVKGCVGYPAPFMARPSFRNEISNGKICYDYVVKKVNLLNIYYPQNLFYSHI